MLLRALAAVVLAGGPAMAATPVPADEVCAFDDVRIHESSGLVDLGRLMVTTNDSGDSARVFVVDPRSCRTVGITEWSADAVDVEALAPAGDDEVWVGDIGDNSRRRSSVVVYRVPVAARRIDVPEPAAYRLVYPDGAHDAESLFADPTGRLFVVTKAFSGGVVYRAPYPLRAGRDNRLEAVAHVPDYATDAALLPDGQHVLVRGPAQASVYRLPGFTRVGTFDLPRQRQGEGVSVGPGGRIRLSSEGVHAPVLEVAIPDEVRAAMRAGPEVTPAGPEPSAPRREPVTGSSTWVAWLVGGLAALVAAVVGWTLRRNT